MNQIQSLLQMKPMDESLVTCYIDDKQVNCHTWTELDYWNGNVPDEHFDEYLNIYGYEYTP